MNDNMTMTGKDWRDDNNDENDGGYAYKLVLEALNQSRLNKKGNKEEANKYIYD